jgi:hypothetical protein
MDRSHKKKEVIVEKPAETQTSIRLASLLVRAPNSKSGGHESEFQHGLESGALITQNGEDLQGTMGVPGWGAAGGVPVPFLPVGGGRVRNEEGIMGVPGRVLPVVYPYYLLEVAGSAMKKVSWASLAGCCWGWNRASKFQKLLST